MDIFPITALGHAGDGIADTPDGPLFVPFTVPGDRVRLEKSGAERARLLELVEASPDRAVPPCARRSRRSSRPSVSAPESRR